MAYEIYGPYSTIDHAKNTIDILGLEGLKNNRILVFANNSISNELQHWIDARIENNNATNQPNDYSLINKIKDFLSGDDSIPTKNMREKLLHLGIADRQVEAYMSDIASGNILIVADNDKRMGNDATDGTTAMEVPVIKRE